MSTPTRTDMFRVLADHYGIQILTIQSILKTPTHPETMRDEFAKAALTGTMGHPKSSGTPIDHATWAYQVADAMLEARLK